MGGGVKSCDITDPYIMVLLMDGTVGMLCLEENGDNPSLELSWPELAKGSKVTLISAYTDTSGMFMATDLKQEVTGDGVESMGVVNDDVIKKEPRTSTDDEDELLYGDVDALTAKLGSNRNQSPPPPPPQPAGGILPGDCKGCVASPQSTTNANWCAVSREDGSLEVYHLHHAACSLALCVRNFSAAPHTLKDSGPVATE